MVRLGYTKSNYHQATGPRTFTLYIFQPWADVHDADAELMLQVRFVKKCCGRGSEKVRLWATEEEINSGEVKTQWH